MVGIHFPAWTVLADVQGVRTKYINFTSAGELEDPEDFDDEYLPLPKKLLRTAYLFSCLDERRDPAMVAEDDIAKGMEVMKDVLKVASESDRDAEELLRLINTNRPGGRGDREPVSHRQLLYGWELISVVTERMLINRRRDSGKETFRFAADVVTQELSRFAATDLEAVDMAIQLYRDTDLLQGSTVPIEILPHLEIGLYEFSSFQEANLKRLTLDWPPDIQHYLKTRLRGEGSSDSQCKVGFAGLSYSQTTIGRPVKLIVRPLAYWVTQQFNKMMAVHPDHLELRRLREKYAADLFRSIEDFRCDCPSSLYLEMVIVTSDGRIPKLLKATKHSVFGKGRGEPVSTCGIEWGFSWKNHVDESADGDQLNVKKALEEGLKKEMSIEPSDVEKWCVPALAIQHAHLNAALLGVVHLRLTKGELLDRLSLPSKYFDESPQFLSIKEALLAIKPDRGTGRWHQTALMRLMLLE